VEKEPLGPDISKPESEAWGLCEGLQGHMCPTLPVSPTSVQVLEVTVLVDQVILVEERSPARANPWLCREEHSCPAQRWCRRMERFHGIEGAVILPECKPSDDVKVEPTGGMGS
jgi:hypothetical protein